MEILAIAIRNQENIKGMSINGLETKLLQYADDTTAILSDLDSAQAYLYYLNCLRNVDWLLSELQK